MIRVVVFLASLLALAFGMAWLADKDGTVALTWLGATYEVHILTAIIALLALMIALALLWSLLRTLLRLPALMGMASRNRRKQKGYDAVSKGLVAIASGDHRTAGKQANEAQRLLGAQPLAMLLSAQSAQLAGDSDKAGKAFNTMLEQADTRLVGLRGLFIEAERKGDGAAARFYADEAYKLAPGTDWSSEAALSYRCQEGDWQGALNLVEQAVSRRLITKDAGKTKRALLLTADAFARAAHDPDGAFRAVQEAVKLDPSLVPAAAYLGKRYAEKAEMSRASKMLEANWVLGPHPDVAEAYLNVRLGDSGKDKLKRARTLLRLMPAHEESRLTTARAAIDAREFATARENLDVVVLEHPTVRACILMAELEEAESGNMGLVREWLARAARAQRDKAWVADGRISDVWAPVSPAGKLGGYVWTTPPQQPGGLLLTEMKLRETPPAFKVEEPKLITEAAVVAITAPVIALTTPLALPEDMKPAMPDGKIMPLKAPDDPGADTDEAPAAAPKKWRLFG
jgi:HemY protein